jgi:basic membrane lipoprotein Med (substrate-binding protein (PBP1-ABC) superfamily)/DNA-binding SARP family transcriptional activator
LGGAVRFRLLGSLEVETGSGPIDLGPHKQRSVLAILLLHANEIVPTDRIIDLVWGDSAPRTAEHSVHMYVSQLRKAVADDGGSLIETHPPGYVIHVSADEVDYLRFERLVEEGLAALRAGDPRRARVRLELALDFWKGEPLSEFSYDEFAQEPIRLLRDRHHDALEALAGIYLDEGDLDATTRMAREVIAGDPFREEPHRLMMLALYGSRRQAQALRHYNEYRAQLGDDLGIEPSEGLRDLEERILVQDPTLGRVASDAPRPNPYRGLRPFDEEDSDVFFGRESLVSEVLDRLNSGPGLVSIVGPSGSGKSSVARAGVVPRLRREGAAVAVMQPGVRPLWELAGTLDRAGLGPRASLLRRFESDSRSLAAAVRHPIVLVVDQFEELFTVAERGATIRFCELIANAIRAADAPLRVITTLRADYYDRPLSIPVLAGLFVDSVVNVGPMTPGELERVVVEPARAVGVAVEPALLVQVVGDMGLESGALPLLQMALFELFELTPDELTLAGYEKLGGIRGALADGAESVLSELDPVGRELTEQLMMRMVHTSQSTTTARPAEVREILDLRVDNVILQQVLEAFAARRLLTFDRDSSGTAVIELAHECLISEWPRMAGWIEAHREDLDRIGALDAAAAEWTAAESSSDYLLRGERLEAVHAWSTKTTLRLTRAESQFIDSSLQLRHREIQDRFERQAREESLARSARRRLWAFGAAVAALAAAITFLVVVLVPEPPPDAIVWYEGRGDASFGDLIASGIDAAVEDFGLEIQEFTLEANQMQVVEQPLAAGTELAFISTAFVGEEAVATRELIDRHPGTSFVILDCVDVTETLALYPDNVSCIAHRNEEIGFVAGVAAALTSETGHIGMIAGLDYDLIHQFRDGFLAGAQYVDPSIEADVIYLSRDFHSAFFSTTLASMAATVMYRDGADVVFHAAGGSGHGLFKTAALWSDPGPKVWAVGVDVDQWVEVGNLGLPDDLLALTRDHLLTSALKRLDVGIYEAVRRYVEEGEVGDIELGMDNGGVGYATSGGHVGRIVPDLDAAMAAVAGGSVQIEVDYERPVVLLEDVLLGSDG